jgi:hypothetical protein
VCAVTLSLDSVAQNLHEGHPLPSRVQGAYFRVLGSKFQVLGSGLQFQVSGSGLQFQVLGAGFSA